VDGICLGGLVYSDLVYCIRLIMVMYIFCCAVVLVFRLIVAR
jgi:hypothetical protein